MDSAAVADDGRRGCGGVWPTAEEKREGLDGELFFFGTGFTVWSGFSLYRSAESNQSSSSCGTHILKVFVRFNQCELDTGIK